MSTPVKLHGFNLGKLEKDVIKLMREGDEPPGKPILIWVGICQTYGIDFSAGSKKDQTEELYKENQYKCAISRLIKVRLIKLEIMPTSKGTFLVPNPRGLGYNYYSLTKLGRLVADKLLQQEHQRVRSLRVKADLRKAFDQLCDLGYVQVTIEQIREVLWQLSGDTFGSRAEFDEYLSNVKIGRMLQYCSVKRTRVSKKDRRQKYQLI
ncbi:MAG: hypothetical protein FWC33_02730 [Candidatus Bathyarchaeota archaeon]|nr:hypothetical protein [Candidatus Termiticorpusculum sp.]